MRSLDVLIVDDSAFVRRAVERIVSGIAGARIVGTAADGREAVLRARELRPDLVLLDVNMPEMDGLEALREIMRVAPTAVILLSSVASAGATETLEALELGAVDFIDKSLAGREIDIYALGPMLEEKIRAIAETGASDAERRVTATGSSAALVPVEPERGGDCPFDLIIIGASTGGPRALARLLPSLPGTLGAAVVVAQHMPPGFTGPLARRLDPRSELEVREAQDGDTLRAGSVLVVPGGCSAWIVRDSRGFRLRVDEAGEQSLYRPSVDELLASAADVVGARAMGVVLTGMGRDGADGLRRLRNSGGRTIAESEETAVIYGMPRAAAEVAELVLPLDRIGPTIAHWCRASIAPQDGE